MNPVELARPVFNKVIVPEREGRGRNGHGRQPAVRPPIYVQLVGIHKDKKLVNHLKKNPSGKPSD